MLSCFVYLYLNCTTAAAADALTCWLACSCSYFSVSGTAHRLKMRKWSHYCGWRVSFYKGKRFGHIISNLSVILWISAFLHQRIQTAFRLIFCYVAISNDTGITLVSEETPRTKTNIHNIPTFHYLALWLLYIHIADTTVIIMCHNNTDVIHPTISNDIVAVHDPWTHKEGLVYRLCLSGWLKKLSNNWCFFAARKCLNKD